MRKEYQLTPAEDALLDLIVSLAPSSLLDPFAHETQLGRIIVFWRVIGEHKGFNPETLKSSGGDESTKFTAESL